MRTITVLLMLCLLNCAYAQQFQLEALEGAVTGPFELKEGVVVAIGDSRATIKEVKRYEDQVLDTLSKIRIPEVDCRSANIRDVIDFLHKSAVKHGQGMRVPSFILKLNSHDDESLDPFAEPDSVAQTRNETMVTFSALDITLKEALDILVDISGLKYQISGSVVMIVPMDTPDGEIMLRSYTLAPLAYEGLINTAPHPGGDLDLKRFFTEMGVSWPRGSHLNYIAGISELVVANTSRNIERLEQVLGMLCLVPFQVEIEVQFVSFDLVDIAKQCGSGINMSSLMRLWESGHGELVAAPRVVTQNGQQATIKDVIEYIYPTSFKVHHDGGTNTNDTVIASIVEPDDFETREVGTILEAMPDTSSADNLMNITLCTEIVREPEWQEYGAKYVDSNGKEQQAHMPQPFFSSYSTTTVIRVKDGESVMIGGGTPSKDGSRMIYMFLTARKIGVSGERVGSGRNSE